MSKIFKNISILYLIYSIVFYANPVFALDLGGWVKTGTSRSGASSTYNGSRSYNPNYGGSSSINTTATLVPLGIDVASMLLKGSGWALAISALGIAYQGYTAVQDFQNNRVKLTKQNTGSNEGQTTSQYAWFNPEIGDCYGISTCESAVNQVYQNAHCELTTETNMRCNLQYTDGSGVHGSYMNLGRYLNYQYNPNIIPSAEDIIYVPLPQVGDLIISQANAGNQDAVDFLGDISDSSWTDAPASPALKAKLQNQLNANAEHPSDTNASSTSTGLASSTTPNASGTTTTTSHSETQTELPAFCKYASKLCDWLDWSQKEIEDNEDGKLPQVTPNIAMDTEQRLNFGTQCPQPLTANIPYFGTTLTFQFDYQFLCTPLANYVRPFIIALGYLYAGYIIFGVSFKKD